MKLTNFSDYSLRVLIYLGAKETKASIAEMSAAFNISKNHLVKASHNLVKLGYVRSIRGKTGGLLLDPEAKDVSLRKIIQELEPDMTLVECFNREENTCVITPSCQLRSILNEAKNAFLKILEQYTLSDLLKNKRELNRLLY